MFGGKRWSPEGLHCYVTGGSAGLGQSLAVLLAARGAHVSIVARTKANLDATLTMLEAARVAPSQKFAALPFDIFTYAGAEAALLAATAAHGGRFPDALFLCAGSSFPRFVVETTEQQMIDGMNSSYWVQAFTAMIATKMLAKRRAKGKIVFVCSTLAYMSMVGYATYTPGKTAIRGLADCLRSEGVLYDLSVHVFFPPTIYSPGYENENRTKPKITLDIEKEDDVGLSPENAAKAMLAGVLADNMHITADFNTALFRASTRGVTPYNNVFLDSILGCLAWVGVPIWRSHLDKRVRSHRREHEEHLRQTGFYED